jgi:hypothetical protein
VQVGPVVAGGVPQAAALVASALSQAPGRSAVVDVPADRPEWLDTLRGLGFVEERPLTRMYRGTPPKAEAAGRQLAILGPELG